MSRSIAIKSAAMALPLLLIGLLVVNTTRAAFSDTTDNSGNSIAAGTVALSDNDSGSAMFNVTNMRPGAGNAVESCIDVSYDGSIVPADVKLYVASGDLGGTGLADYLDLTVERGTGAAGFGDCTGFSSSETVYSGGTLDDMAGAATDFSSGLGTWAPAATSETQYYRFHMQLQSNNLAQGLTASVNFTWEAQNQ